MTSILVVFDWNGTVMDDVPRARVAVNRVMASAGLDALTDDDVRRTFRLPMTEWMVSLGVAAADAESAARAWSTHVAGVEAPARSDAKAVLETLRSSGATVGVASAAELDVVRNDARGCGLLEVVDTMAAGVTDKAAYLRSVRGTADRAVYVGDCEYDVVSARDAGFEAVAVAGGYRSAADLLSAGPDVVLDDLTGLLEYLSHVPA